jgi:hypothetical protein
LHDSLPGSPEYEPGGHFLWGRVASQATAAAVRIAKVDLSPPQDRQTGASGAAVQTRKDAS